MTQEQVADKLLWGLWRSISDEYKDRYKKEVWDHFENAIKSASYTGSLKGFLDLFQRRIPTQIQMQFMQDIMEVVDSNDDDTILNWFRTETTYMVMIVRIKNQERKEIFK